MTDFATARANMVESQVRPNEVTDPRILDAMLAIPRELFVPPSARAIAYMDEEIVFETMSQMAGHRYMLAPMTLAKMVNEAAVLPGDLVLDVGCTTGYSSVLLGRLAEAVVGLECDKGLAETAGRNVVELEADNVAIVTGDLAQGYPEEGPFDVIVLQGSVPQVPNTLLAQLKEGGRLVAIIGDRDVGEVCVYRNITGHIGRVSVFDAAAPPLPGFEVAAEFIF